MKKIGNRCRLGVSRNDHMVNINNNKKNFITYLNIKIFVF